MALKKEEKIEIFEFFKTDNPNPVTELEFVNNYTLLVAVVLSAQATDIGVNKATKKLFQLIDNPKDMLALGEEKLKHHIKTIGLFNSKAKNVIILSQQLLDNHNGEVPDNMESLIKLAGVGRKTANVILNCAFGKPTMAVDTHVQRVSNRIGLARSKDVLKTEQQLYKSIPKDYLFNAHHWLILHGRYVCKARKPDCKNCGIIEQCQFKKKEL